RHEDDYLEAELLPDDDDGDGAKCQIGVAKPVLRRYGEEPQTDGVDELTPPDQQDVDDAALVVHPAPHPGDGYGRCYVRREIDGAEHTAPGPDVLQQQCDDQPQDYRGGHGDYRVQQRVLESLVEGRVAEQFAVVVDADELQI